MNQVALLTEEHRRNWQRDGYLVVRRVVDSRTIEMLQKEIWSFLKMSPEKSETWYDEVIRSSSGIDRRGMIPIYHSPGMWEVRQNEAIYRVFSEILCNENIVVSFDRLNMNPPSTPEWVYEGFMHWDIDITKQSLPLQVQGLVALTDSGDDSGGFQCVAGFHHQLPEWLAGPGQGFVGRFPDTTSMTVTSVPLYAGDLLVWKSELPHGNTANMSTKPRIAQYITFQSISGLTDADIEARRRSFLHGTPPLSSTMAKMFPKQMNQLLKHSFELSDHGKRILGFRT